MRNIVLPKRLKNLIVKQKKKLELVNNNIAVYVILGHSRTLEAEARKENNIYLTRSKL